MKQPTAEQVDPDVASPRDTLDASPPDALDADCLAEDVVHALALGELEARERSQALAHLDECELCQTLLAEEVRDLPEFASSDETLRTLIEIGDLVGGRYRIKRFVARGGMGEVYEAWDVLLGERVALKTINPAASPESQDKANARFRREAQLSRRVGDSHVCRIYEFGQHLVQGFGPVSYLTMEFIEGQTLGTRLRQGPPLSMDEVMALSLQMLRGLSAAHAVGVLHRDLKSDNVMLRDDSASSGSLHAVIMDFGLARVLGDEAHGVTERHEFVGSAAYMAPEQLEDVPVLSQATDVYAFGVVLYEMLTGRLPFDGKSAMAIAMRRLTHEALPPSHHVPELSAPWDDLVMRCLERDVSRRYNAPEQVQAALDAIAQRASTPPVPAPSRQRRHPRAFVVASAGVLLVAGGYLSLRTADDVSAGASELRSATFEARPAPAPSSAPTGEPDRVPPEGAAQFSPPTAPPAEGGPEEAEPESVAARGAEVAVATPAPTSRSASSASATAAPTPSIIEPGGSRPTPRERPAASPTPRERLASRPTASKSAPALASSKAVEASAKDGQPRLSTRSHDVRDLFFLEQPRARPPQNSNE